MSLKRGSSWSNAWLPGFSAITGSSNAFAGYDGYLTLECLQPEARERPVETARRDRLMLEDLLADPKMVPTPPDAE